MKTGGIWATLRRALRFAALSFAILFGLASIIATGGGGGGGGVGVTGTTWHRHHWGHRHRRRHRHRGAAGRRWTGR